MHIPPRTDIFSVSRQSGDTHLATRRCGDGQPSPAFLLSQAAIAFDIVRYAGAIYLVYLGIRTLLSKHGGPLRLREVNPATPSYILQQGILTGMLNPKGILVFAALLPQFVNPHIDSVPLQMTAFGLTFTLICLCIYGGYAYLSGSLGEKLAAQPLFASVLLLESLAVCLPARGRELLDDRRDSLSTVRCEGQDREQALLPAWRIPLGAMHDGPILAQLTTGTRASLRRPHTGCRPATRMPPGTSLVCASELLPAEIANRYESEHDRVDGHGKQRRI